MRLDRHFMPGLEAAAWSLSLPIARCHNVARVCGAARRGKVLISRLMVATANVAPGSWAARALATILRCGSVTKSISVCCSGRLLVESGMGTADVRAPTAIVGLCPCQADSALSGTEMRTA